MMIWGPVFAADLALRSADRAAIERVYYNYRLGEKPPFEKVLPPAALENLIRQELQKEAALKAIYGVEVTPAMLEAEVQRIDATTRAPEILAEIKRVLGNDASRFASGMVRPIIVERELRRCFDNDDKLHAAQRREAELARESLLVGRTLDNLHDVTWQLTARPEVVAPEITAPPPKTESVAKSAAYSVEANAQIAQNLTPLTSKPEQKL